MLVSDRRLVCDPAGSMITHEARRKTWARMGRDAHDDTAQQQVSDSQGGLYRNRAGWKSGIAARSGLGVGLPTPKTVKRDHHVVKIILTYCLRLVWRLKRDSRLLERAQSR